MRKSTFTPEYQAFCRLLVEAREQAGLSQHDLARLLRTRQDWVSRYEAGQRRLDVIQVWRIMRAVSLDPAAFMVKLNEELTVIEDSREVTVQGVSDGT